MSADNGIYIAKFKDGYRVCYAQAIDNLDYFPRGSQEERDEWKAYFGHSPVFQDEKDAVWAAYEMAKDEPILEYGVRNLGTGVDWEEKR